VIYCIVELLYPGAFALRLISLSSTQYTNSDVNQTPITLSVTDKVDITNNR